MREGRSRNSLQKCKPADHEDRLAENSANLGHLATLFASPEPQIVLETPAATDEPILALDEHPTIEQITDEVVRHSLLGVFTRNTLNELPELLAASELALRADPFTDRLQDDLDVRWPTLHRGAAKT